MTIGEYKPIPLQNTEWTCTLDAFIQCKMRENRDKLEWLDYIEPITKWRDKLRLRFKSWEHNQHVNGMLTFLQDQGIINEVYEITPREKPIPPFIATIKDLKYWDLILESWVVWINHAMCVIGETEEYWIIFNDWGSEWGVNGYGYLKKGEHAYYWWKYIYHYFN